jgi:hypothetical protein
MQHTPPNYHDPLPASERFDFSDFEEFDSAEDDFLDRHLAAIRESINDLRNQ